MPAYKLRKASADDLPALEALWRYAFAGDGEAFTRWYFRDYVALDEVLVCEVGGAVVASSQLIRQTLRRGDRTLPVRYIVGVNCYPEWRGHGLVRALMQAMLQEAPVGAYLLMPFEADFYRAYDFVFIDHHGDLDLSMEEMIPLASKGPYRAERRDLSEQSPFAAVYQGWQERYFSYYQERDDRRWRSVLDDLAMEEGKALILKEGERPVGYLLYRITGEALWVREMAYLNEAARAGLYYLIASHRSQVKRVQWSAPLSEPLVAERSRDKEGVRYKPFMMLRIVDPQVATFFAEGAPEMPVAFQVVDHQRDWRAGYLWDASGLRESEAEPVLTFSIGEWASLVSGQLSEARLADRLGERLKDPAALSRLMRLFPKSDAFFNEYF